MKKMFKSEPYIHYANCYEEPNSLFEFYPLHAKNVVSIGSGGDNSLALLSRSPEKLYILDRNKAQINLIKLKIEAIKRLSYGELLVFLGVRGEIKSGEALRLYKNIKEYLPLEVKEFFDGREEIFTKLRVIGCGKFENYLKVFSKKMLPLIHSKKKMNEFMSLENLTEQGEFYEKRIDTFRWRFFTRFFFSRLVVSRLGRDKAFFKYAKDELSDNIVRRLKRCVNSCSNSCNPYLQFSVFNRFDNLPYYLTEQAYQTIKQNLDKIVFIEDDISAIQRLNEKIDFFNLSDIFEYMDEQSTLEIEYIISQSASEGARVVFWNMLVDRSFTSQAFAPLETQDVLNKERIYYYGKLLCYEKARGQNV